MTGFFKAAVVIAALAFATSAFAQAPQSVTPGPGGALLDLNSASKEELSALPGIGDVRSDAIIKGRPYKGKDDLAQKRIVSRGVYDKIKDRIIAKQKNSDNGAAPVASTPFQGFYVGGSF